MSLFVPISELDRHEGRKVHLVGVVVEFSFFRKTAGTDYVCVLKIVDNSGNDPSSLRSKELTVNIFTESTNQLPRIRSYGDLVVLRKVQIKKHKDELFAVFNKKFSQFGLLDGQYTHFVHYQSLGSFSLTWNEQRVIADLKAWWHHSKQNSERTQYLLPMKSILMDNFFDLVCKVLHVCYDAAKNVWIVYVWDGTDVPPLSLDGNLPNEQISYVPLQIESTPLESDVIRRFERLGTILRLMTEHGQEYFGSNFPGIGKWVIFRNMQCRFLGGMWYGILNAYSRVRLLANDDNIVESCESDYRRRESERGRLPLFYFANRLTGVNNRDVQFSTLMDVVVAEQDDEEFFCVVRVVALSLIGGGSYSVSDDIDLELQTFILTLEDATTRVHAILRPLDLVTFFEYRNGDIFQENVKKLLGVSQHADLSDARTITRCPSWIECTIVTGRDEEGRRCYFVNRS